MNDLASGGDRLDLLRTFLRIVDSGSLSAAAVQLGTTQPTVSRRLQALERQLGLRLLQRSTHGLLLTEDGQRAANAMRSGWWTNGKRCRPSCTGRHRGSAAACG